MIVVKRVEVELLREVRFRVLWPHLNGPEEAVIDVDGGEGAIHLAAFESGEVVGVASLFPQGCFRYPEMFKGMNSYRLRAMGVLQECQGRGVGGEIISFAKDLLDQTTHTHVLWCDAREIAWGFYSRQGFKYATNVDGNPCDAYEVPNVGVHKMMYFCLSNLQKNA